MEIKPRYKINDYIKIIGGCNIYFINKTVRIHEICGDCYMIDLLNGSYYRPWSIRSADLNSHLDITATILYKDKLCTK